MSHGITQSDQMAYVGQTPWHGLGVALPAGATIAQMLDAANLGWRIDLYDLDFAYRAPLGFVEQRTVGHRAMVRADTGLILDVVGPKYTPAQNDEVLKFFEAYLAAGSLTLDTAGSLHGGKMVWGLGKLAVEFTLPGGDRVIGYLLIANPNEYGKGLKAKLVVERVVCHNTMTIALAETGAPTVTIAHDRTFDEFARADAVAKLGHALNQFEGLRFDAMQLAQKELDPKNIDAILADIFDCETPEKLSRRAARVLDLYEGEAIGGELASANGTAWGLLNAVTQFVDHEACRTQDARLNNAWFGWGAAVKRKATNVLLATIEN